jgi:quinol monooxygenase YgiN
LAAAGHSHAARLMVGVGSSYNPTPVRPADDSGSLDMLEGLVAIKVVIEFQAKPGERATLKSLLTSISTAHAPTTPGYLGSTVYETVDTPDGLVEIAEWESAEAQAAAVGQASAAGVYAPVVDLVAAPFRVTRIGQPS